MKALAASGEKGVLELMVATHAGMTTEQFSRIVAEWVAKALHPRTRHAYTEMVYQPMLELLAYLRDNEFKTFIVSGGGVEFMRVFAERVYGIRPSKSSAPAGPLMRLPKVDFIDKAGKPVGIQKFIGRRPVFPTPRCGPPSSTRCCSSVHSRRSTSMCRASRPASTNPT